MRTRDLESRREQHARRTVRAIGCIRRLVNTLGESARAVEQRTGITNAQLFLLRQLEREDALSINELAARALTQQSTISLLVQKLEKSGYVRRERAADDGRRVLATLTARGRTIVRRAPEPPLARMAGALDRMPARDIEAVIRGIGALLKAMNVSAGTAPLIFETPGDGKRPRRTVRRGR